MPRQYTERDRISVFIALQSNNGNVRRTARDTGLPEQTVRDWKHQWDEEEPDFDVELVEEATGEALAFADHAERVRNYLLEVYEKAVQQGKVSPDKLPVHIGILDDKIRLTRGLATSRSETVHTLPSPEEVQQLFAGHILAALEAAKEREQDIIEAEFTEEQPRGLPAPANKE